MKIVMRVLMAAVILTASMPGFALANGDLPGLADDRCAKECDLLLKNCASDVDSIQQRINKINAAMNKDGADQEKLENLKALKRKLDEAKAMLQSLEKPGR